MDSKRTQLSQILDNAYAPYAGVKVAALVITSKGEFSGVNVENVVNPSSSCAERNAIFNAISASGTNQKFLEVHVFSQMDTFLFPCGGCLQVMSEFFARNAKIHVYNREAEKVFLLSDLLPHAPTNLKQEIAKWK